MLLLIFFLTNLSITWAVEFPKSLDTNTQFPPILQRRENQPTGHLRPLGWQNRAQSAVNEEAFILSPKQFWHNYITQQKPVMIPNLVSNSESIDKWTDKYLSHTFGSLDIQATRRKESYRKEMQEMESISLKDFLKRYRSDDLYLRVILPEVMHGEVPMPSLISCGPFVGSGLGNGSGLARLVEPYLWISAGDTSSLLQAHPEHNLHCMLDGRMDFILVPGDQFKGKKVDVWRKKLDLHETFKKSGELFSKIDVDMVNAYKYDILQEITWTWSTVKAGDCIYIPSGYLHQIRSHARSISTSVYFTTLKKKPEQTMDQFKLEQMKSLNECPLSRPSFEPMSLFNENFLWTHTHGERHLKDKHIGEDEARNYLVYLMRDDCEELNYERFEAFYNEITKELVEEKVVIDASDVWSDLFLPQKSEMTLSQIQIRDLKLQPNLERFTRVLNKASHFHDGKSRDEL